MKLIDNILYIEWAEMLDCGVPENTLKSARSKETKCWSFIDDPRDNRRVLIHYEDLRQDYKDKIKARFGNPYDMVAREPILVRVQNRPEAHNFFLGYKFDGEKKLDISVVDKYTRADAWLNFINQMGAKEIKQLFPGLKVPDFYSHVTHLIEIEKANGKDKEYKGIKKLPGDFPGTYQRLKTKAENYRNGTFEDLISKQYSNKNSTKLGLNEGGFDPELYEKQMAVIRAVAAKHNNFDAGQVKIFADVIFKKNGWETISKSRINQILKKNMVILKPGRRGKRSFNSEIAMQIKRTAPKFPTYYWTLDGWTVELLYQENGTYNNRLVVVVVLDPAGKYPVGYAIGERENADLIKAAMRNAIEHINSIFGRPEAGYYAPWQIQSDNYAIKQLTPFHQAAGHLFTPAAVGNAKAKVIEPYFMYLNKRYCQTQPNWSGFNVTASKDNQVNNEFLNMIKKTFPDKEGVMWQIHQMIQWEREQKGAEYLSKWHEMSEKDRHILTEENRLMVFGQPIGLPNQITGQGLVKQIDRVKYTYDCFEPLFRQNMHLKWQLIADQEDMTKVLAVSPDNKLRFVLNSTMEIPMDARSMLPEHHEHLSKVKAYNKETIKLITDTYAADAATVAEVISSTPLAIDQKNEADLKLMFTDNRGQQKEHIQNAKGLKVAEKEKTKRIKAAEAAEQKSWQQQQAEFLRSKTDFNQFAD